MEQRMHSILIDEKKDVYDNEERRVTRTDVTERFNGRLPGGTRLVAVLKAFVSCKETITDIDMIEVTVDGSPFS